MPQLGDITTNIRIFTNIRQVANDFNVAQQKIVGGVQKAVSATSGLAETFAKLGYNVNQTFVVNASAAEFHVASLTTRIKEWFATSKNSLTWIGRIGAGVIIANFAYRLSDAVRSAITGANEMFDIVKRIQLTTGDMGSTVAEYFEIISGAAEGSLYSLRQTADAMKILAMSGVDVKNNTQVLDATMNMATISMMDLGEAGRVMVQILRAFNMEADKAAHVSDVLAKVADMSTAEVDDLAQGMKFLAAQAGLFGISYEEAAAALGIVATSMGDAGIAGRGLRSALMTLSAPSQEAERYMRRFGIQARIMSGEAQTLQDYIRIFNEQLADVPNKVEIINRIFTAQGATAFITLMEAELAAAEGLQTFGESAASLEDWVQTLGDVDGYAEYVAGELADTLTGRIAQMNRAIESLAMNVLDVLMPTLLEFMDTLNAVFEDEAVREAIITTISLFGGLAPQLQTIIVAFAGLITVIKPFLPIIVPLIAAIVVFKAALLIVRAVLQTFISPVKTLYEWLQATRVSVSELSQRWTDYTARMKLVDFVVQEAAASIARLQTLFEVFANYELPKTQAEWMEVIAAMERATMSANANTAALQRNRVARQSLNATPVTPTGGGGGGFLGGIGGTAALLIGSLLGSLGGGFAGATIGGVLGGEPGAAIGGGIGGLAGMFAGPYLLPKGLAALSGLFGGAGVAPQYTAAVAGLEEAFGGLGLGGGGAGIGGIATAGTTIAAVIGASAQQLQTFGQNIMYFQYQALGPGTEAAEEYADAMAQLGYNAKITAGELGQSYVALGQIEFLTGDLGTKLIGIGHMIWGVLLGFGNAIQTMWGHLATAVLAPFVGGVENAQNIVRQSAINMANAWNGLVQAITGGVANMQQAIAGWWLSVTGWWSEWWANVQTFWSSWTQNVLGGAYATLEASAPQAQMGGFVRNSGLVFAHAGEVISPASEVARRQYAQDINVTIRVEGSGDVTGLDADVLGDILLARLNQSAYIGREFG